jgi:hypothetical protein
MPDGKIDFKVRYNNTDPNTYLAGIPENKSQVKSETSNNDSTQQNKEIVKS